MSASVLPVATAPTAQPGVANPKRALPEGSATEARIVPTADDVVAFAEVLATTPVLLAEDAGTALPLQPAQIEAPEDIGEGVPDLDVPLQEEQPLPIPDSQAEIAALPLGVDVPLPAAPAHRTTPAEIPVPPLVQERPAQPKVVDQPPSLPTVPQGATRAGTEEIRLLQPGPTPAERPASTTITAPPSITGTSPSAPPPAQATVAPSMPIAQKAEPRSDKVTPPPATPLPTVAASPGSPPNVPNQMVPPLTLASKPSVTGAETSDPARSAVADLTPLGRGGAEPVTSQTAPQPTAPTPRMDLAAHVARQIGDIAQHMPARPVEISLSPEELGRVRLSLSTHETGIVLNVLAERPETTDLLKRHIGLLGQQFQSLGFENIAFSFGQNQADGQTTPESADQRGDVAAAKADETPLRVTLTPAGSTGVDIRL